MRPTRRWWAARTALLVRFVLARLTLRSHSFNVSTEMKSLLVALGFIALWGSSLSHSQGGAWVRVESIQEFEAINTPSIAILSNAFSADLSKVQAEIARQNGLREEGLPLYLVDCTKVDPDALKTSLGIRDHLRLPEVAVQSHGKWTVVQFLAELMDFFRKHPLKKAPQFYERIATEAFDRAEGTSALVEQVDDAN